MKEKTQKTYISKDGIEFNSKEKCELYEKSLNTDFIKELQKYFVFFDRKGKLTDNIFEIGNFCCQVKEVPSVFIDMFNIFCDNQREKYGYYSCSDFLNFQSNFYHLKKYQVWELQSEKYSRNEVWVEIANKKELLKQVEHLQKIIEIYNYLKSEY